MGTPPPEEAARWIPAAPIDDRRSLKHVRDNVHGDIYLDSTVGDGVEKAPDSPKEMNGVCNDVPDQVASAPSIKSSFNSPFCTKVEAEMDSGTDKAFRKELSTLNRCSSMRYDKKVNSSNRRTKLLPVTEVTHRSPKIQSMCIDDEPRSSGMQKDQKRTRPPHLSGGGLFSPRKASLPTRSSSRFKGTEEETVVLLDLGECEPEETTQEDQGEQETLNRDIIIYYPSRNDSGSIEIHYCDMDCLAPQTYMSSTIMNFYIRYLQEKWPPLKITDEGEGIHDYHLFNTFFYEKLREATNKKADEYSFAKLRRWWKNVKLFQKAYIFVPIHENSHWSLVIVCMPNKEDHRSGLLLLHLDSLGIHTSTPIFRNIKSFLKEEWMVVKDEATYDVPIAESVWENLPRRIEEHTVEVPQQRNDYDCGLFVLYFMERFILDAPERLKKKNLKMFGKKWFNPKEASDLRRLIREMLEKKFQEEGELDKEQVLDDSDLEASPKPAINVLMGKASLPTRSSSRFKGTEEETVVLLDLEECEPEETTQEDQGEQETLNRDIIIYYPSRNDSGSIEIHYCDMDCLAPQTYMSSTIMNFYIRYLQEKWPPLKITDEGEGIHDYHLFNTFFYEKLREATNKKADEYSFAKLRRWWKNVKLFQKAYIFVPIHENSHWSLVIVCMPNKEDHRSGLLLLHLDSLGIHTSTPIFRNIKSFLKEEWMVVKDEATYDVPIAESVWENLPRRIEEHTVEVPQQRNDYDCGLFVLYFMERFILDAPERLKKKNLKMFGKKWFNPKEASDLRRLIREMLEKKFQEEGELDKEQVLDDSDLEASPKPAINVLMGKASLPTRSSSRFKGTEEETVVLLDLEECEPEETTQEDQGEQETLNRDIIIYYPSRNDSGSIEIHYCDMDCLAPQTYMSSTIMNFYIRYLQEKWPPLKITDEGEGIHDYHLFNTFFYEKLREATNKKADEYSFAKLRRWWKNVKLFQKAYIFVPIHENSHWSLVIVCMPNKEDHRSGLLLLHLDSLGIHTSTPIFRNIKSFLKEEWMVVKDEATYDVPIAESVWENLPRRIEEHTIEVPQQRNDYDCGLFVLYFMERFILDAPERLKKKNLKMFGKKWFNPKEASDLRRLIRELLEKKFQEEGEPDKEQVLEDSDLEAFPKPEINVLIA